MTVPSADPAAPPPDLPLPPGLALRRAAARLALLFEQVWPAIWPALGVTGAFVCAALLGLPPLLPPLVHLALLAVVAVLVLGLLSRGLARIALPHPAASDRRLERASGLAHRPLATLIDRPAELHESSLVLWQAHRLRALKQVRRLRVGWPRPGLARQDRRALRGAVVVGLIASACIAGEDGPARLLSALRPTLPRAAAAPLPELQAWITPPAYTHEAPIYLHADRPALSVPTGSHLTVSVTGGSGQPGLGFDGQQTPFRALDKTSFQADRDLTTNGHIEVRRAGRDLAAWDITLIPDLPPTASWAGSAGPVKTGQQIRLPWKASDDYGVESLQAEIRLRDRRAAPPLKIAIPLPEGAKTAHGIAEPDLTAHPWAGLPVIAQLVAKDAPGQVGRSAEAAFTLPERPFRNPIARSLIEIRKGLSRDPDNHEQALAGLDALMVKPEAFKNDLTAFTNLSGIYYELEYDTSAGAVEHVQQRIWELALHMEESGLEKTARALEQARREAKQALEKATKDPTAQNKSELERKLEALEQAIQKRMEALAQQLKDQPLLDPQARKLDSREMQKLAEEARQAAQQGKMDEAQQRMAELERMLDQLRNARPMTAQERQQQQERQRGRQQMGAVQDMVAREGKLLDQARRREHEAEHALTDEPEAQPTDPGQSREADQRIQQALRRALGELMQQFGDLAGKVPPALGDADQAMQQSANALGKGEDKTAGDSQLKAIEALQKGGQQMAQAMARKLGQQTKMGQGQGQGQAQPAGMGDQDGEGQGEAFGDMPGQMGEGSGRDPLGRRTAEGNNGADEGDDVRVPDQREMLRTQEVEQELRRRGAQRTRPRKS